MNTELKQKIDQIWRESDFGIWCFAVAGGEMEKADMIRQKLFDEGYLSMEMLENELAEKISKLVHTESEIDEYLHLLDRENSDLVNVLIHQELFYKVSEIVADD